MNNEELILQKLTDMQQDITGMQQDITGMKQGITGMKQDITDIKETLSEHTYSLNTLIEWAEDVAVVVRVPFAKTADHDI